MEDEKNFREKEHLEILQEVEKKTIMSVCTDIENNIARREIELEILHGMLKNYASILEKM